MCCSFHTVKLIKTIQIYYRVLFLMTFVIKKISTIARVTMQTIFNYLQTSDSTTFNVFYNNNKTI